GSSVGPAPYPALVRDLQRVIGDEARAQVLEREFGGAAAGPSGGRLPDRVIACVGGGSNAIGTFTPFVDDECVELIGVEAAVGAPPGTGLSRIAAAFRDSGKRAALMPYLMGGFPDMHASRRIGEAYADGGADLVELGVPFSDPLADGPAIHAAATAALRAGA